MAGMSKKEISRLIEHIEPQGVNVTRTTKGLMLRLPDGSSTMVHFSGSDHRERDNVRSRLKRSGVTFPGDHEPLSDRITKARPQKRTLDAGAQLLAGWDQRSITGAQLIRLSQQHPELLPAGSGFTVVTAQRVLYHLGWAPHGPATSRKWLRPLELQPDLFPDPEPEPVTAEPESPAESLELVADVPAPAEPESAPAGPPAAADREFIDTHDSFTADLDQLPDTLTLGELRTMLTAFGLQLELRTWRV